MKVFLFFALLLLVFPVVAAAEYSVPLLAVRDRNDSLEGISATLTLEVIPGKGRVFLETKPFTKIDTQISMRLAKDISCKYVGIDCSNADFIYTIESPSEIVGGPSAGAAAAVLTVLALEGKTYDHQTAITGTINSGGIIGAVGGVPEKVLAGKDIGMETILIPLGDQRVDEAGVFVVSTLPEALAHFTNTPFVSPEREQVYDEEYTYLMSTIAHDLCDRSMRLASTLEEIPSTFHNLSQKANASFASGQFYSAASRCFTANVGLTHHLYQNISKEELEQGIQTLSEQLAHFTEEVNKRPLVTVPSLQTYMIVHERLTDAQSLLEEANVSLYHAAMVSAKQQYAFAEERFASAVSWSAFFAKKGQPVEGLSLDQACASKVEETKERVQYALALYESRATTAQEKLAQALRHQQKEEYALCLYQASLAKAQTDAFIGSVGINETEALTLIAVKLAIADAHVQKEQERGLFPIAGYAYRDYASSLKEDDPGSALLYAQYALELSTFDAYFSPAQMVPFNEEVPYTGQELPFMYVVGLFTGMILIFVIRKRL